MNSLGITPPTMLVDDFFALAGHAGGRGLGSSLIST
jgi:hypothetical protein